jgi:hypothetical protein
MDPIAGFFEGMLQPVIRLTLFALCMLAGCWLGLYLSHVDAYTQLALGQAYRSGLTDMVTEYPSIQTIGAALPQMLIKGLMSIWKFPLVLCVPWLLFRIVIVDTGVLPLAGLTLALQSLETYTIVGYASGRSIFVLIILATLAIAWHLWAWWRETHWVEALDGPAYTGLKEAKDEEDGIFYPPPASVAEAGIETEYATAGEPARESEVPSIASLYAEEAVAGADNEAAIHGESEEERYHRERQAREAQERETRLRLAQQKKSGPGAKGGVKGR